VGSNLFPHKGISDFIDLIAVVSMAMFWPFLNNN
jgi:hypothetical protein